MADQQPITPIAVLSGKDLLIEELKATAAGQKKKGASQWKTLEKLRKENADFAKNGVGVSDEELVTIAADAFTSKRSSRLDCVDEIEMIPQEWLWEGYLPQNQLTHFAGTSAQGKSPVTLDLAARITAGADWPDGTKNIAGPRSVILMASEDNYEDTIKPRLKLAGADLRKVFRFVTTISKDEKLIDVSTRLDTDLEELKKQIQLLPDVALVVIDPITNYLGGKKMNAEEDIRSLLMPISEQVAQALNVCVVTVGHLNRRDKDTSPTARVMGASAFVGVARQLIMFGADPDETGKKYHHIMGEQRNQAAPALKYHTEMVPVDWEGWEGKRVLRVVWDGVSTAHMEDSINPDKEEIRAAIELTVPALKLVLRAGRMQAGQCKEVVLGGAYKDKPDFFWHRARKKAGVVCKQENRQWWWMLEAPLSVSETMFDTGVSHA
jgi:cell division protein ZapA (FtsZ GTPase activity inhibitor)